MKGDLDIRQPTIEPSYIIRKRGNLIEALNNKEKVEFSGSDAATVIQSTINSAGNNAIIFIKKAVYPITTTIKGNAYQTIISEGATLQASASLNGYLIEYDYASYVYSGKVILQGLIIDLNNSTSASGVKVLHVQQSTLKDLEIKNQNKSAGICILLDACHGTKIENCYIHTGHSNGIAIYVKGNANQIRKCWIEDIGKGIMIDGWRDNQIVSNVIQAIDQYAIELIGECYNHKISRNWFESVTDTCILFYDTNTKTRNIIFQNHFDTNVSKMITLDHCVSTLIKQNYCYASSTLTIDANSSKTQLIENDFSNVTINDNGSETKYKDNIGYVTENSGIETGTGSQQTIAHGCDFTPSKEQVIVSNIDDGANPYLSADPDATNIYVTAVNGKQYRWEVKR